MAARQSCTKLTWSEAKARVGEGTGVVKKKGEKPKKLSHVEKIIAKQTGSAESKKEQKELTRKERRYNEKLSAVAAKKAQERHEKHQVDKVKSFQRAREKVASLALKYQSESSSNSQTPVSCDDFNEKQSQILVQCREVQLDEIMALEAMLEEGHFFVCEASAVEDLKDKIEAHRMDEEDPEIIRQIIAHPPLSLLLKLVMADEGNLLDSDAEASVLIRATLPKGYPLLAETDKISSVIPKCQILYFYCSDKTVEVNADKQVESIAHLDETKLLSEIELQLGDTLPDLCVYEILVSWLSENLFPFLKG